ncbi:MAG TPA: transglutaminase family protein, partial [Ottowia sp.]|nr:transglutaminase family protein [Ottowia sp.]
MRIDLSVPTPLAYFASLVQRDAELPLLEAAACLAQDASPELDVQQVLHEVDRLAERLLRQVTRGAGEIERLRGLNRFFFEELGFAGNVNDYYNPDNSY